MSQIDHGVHIKTIFCDLDGCVFLHRGHLGAVLSNPHILLAGVKERFKEWCDRGYTVIITTGRTESMRKLTEKQMCKAGLFWHRLIMDLPRGPRVVINDCKPEKNTKMAACVNLERNKGMENVDI